MDAAPWPAIGIGGRAIVRDGRGRILLIRRSDRVKWDPGLWELPGGKADHGETIEHAVVREAQEEVGLELSVGRPVHVAHFTKKPFWVTSVTFTGDAIRGEVRLSDEHDEFVWAELNDAMALPCTEPAREALAAYEAQRVHP
jgi:8-oxo-dGTP diphosphatase